MTPITCPNPNCKTVSQYPDDFTTFGRGSDDFCPVCDTPLFWVQNPNARATNGTGSDQARWRLPGAGPTGQAALGSRPCPACHERNTMKAVRCFRCDALMNPPPPVFVQPAPEPVTVYVEPPPPPRDRTLLWLLLGVVIVTVTMALVVWLGR